MLQLSSPSTLETLELRQWATHRKTGDEDASESLLKVCNEGVNAIGKEEHAGDVPLAK